MNRDFYEPDHEAFREVVQAYIKREVAPNEQRWEEERSVDRQAWLAAGKQSLIGMLVPEEYGGVGTGDFRYRCVMMEEFARIGATSISSGFGLQDDIAIPYIVDLATDEQKARWLPPMAAGECIGAIAMTEPGAGSDLQGIRTTAVRADDQLDPERRQDVHHQRHQRRPGHRGGAHRPRRGRAGDQPAGGGARHARLQPRPQAGQDRHARAGHRRAVLRRRGGARGQPAGQTRAAASCT